MNSKLKGYIYGIVASATYGMLPLFTLPLYGAGMDPFSVLFFRYLIAVCIFVVMLKSRGGNFSLERGDIGVLALLGIIFATTSISLFSSYKYMDSGVASTLLFVYPVMVAAIMAIFFKERASLGTLLCMAVSLAGIVLLYDTGDSDAVLSAKGILLVMTSALAYAIYIVLINKSNVNRLGSVKLNFYMILFGVLIFAMLLCIRGEITAPPADKWYLWGCLLGLGLLPTAFSLICTTKAVQHIGSTPTAILGAMEPVTAIFFGITIFGEEISGREWLGIILIIAAVSVVVASGNRKRNKQ